MKFCFRAIVTENMIKPVDTPLKQLGSLKRSAGFNRACEELKRHEDLLEEAEQEPVEEEEEDLVRASSNLVQILVKLGLFNPS